MTRLRMTAQEDGKAAEEGDKEVRAACLKLLAHMWQRFPGTIDYQPLWAPFFTAVAVIQSRMEVSTPC